MLSLGVDLAADKIPETLKILDLFQILKGQVDQADPLDGICTELADLYD